MGLKKGQVLWLKLPFGLTDEVSKVFHPYLIIDMNSFGCGLVYVGQMDTDNGKPWELLRGRKIPVDNVNPNETVIYKPSYLQTDRKIQIEYFDELDQYLDTEDTLSQKKLESTINKYYNCRNNYGSDSFRDMYFKKEEVLQYNPKDDWTNAHDARMRIYKQQTQ